MNETVLFTDEKIEELLKAEPEPEVPVEQRHTFFVYYAPKAKTLASALASSPFSHYTTLPDDAKSQFYNLLKTASDAGLQKLLTRNPSIAVSSFSLFFDYKRTSIVKWIFAQKYVPPDKMLIDLVKHNYEEEIEQILGSPDIRPVTLNLCLQEEVMKQKQTKFFEKRKRSSMPRLVACGRKCVSTRR